MCMVSALTTKGTCTSGSFAFSPESPLAAVNDPTASGQILTHCFGLGAIFMLAPVQYVLARAARDQTLVRCLTPPQLRCSVSSS